MLHLRKWQPDGKYVFQCEKEPRILFLQSIFPAIVGLEVQSKLQMIEVASGWSQQG